MRTDRANFAVMTATLGSDQSEPQASEESRAASPFMRFLLWPNLLSLDAPIIAVVWAKLFTVHVGYSKLFAGVMPMLFCSVWFIYLLDRLIDTGPWRKSIPRTLRHQFYRKHWIQLLLLSLVPLGFIARYALGEAFGAFYSVPVSLLHSGGALSAIVVAYFLLGIAGSINRIATSIILGILGCLVLVILLLLQLPTILIVAFLVATLFTVAMSLFSEAGNAAVVPKEILCGIIFAVGTTMPVYWHMSDAPLLPVEMINFDVLAFAALCTVNCIAISVWEKNADCGSDPRAIAQYFPEAEIILPKLCLAMLTFAAINGLLDPGSWLVQTPIALSALTLLVTHRNRDRMDPNALRIAADASLLWPLCFIPLA